MRSSHAPLFVMDLRDRGRGPFMKNSEKIVKI